MLQLEKIIENNKEINTNEETIINSISFFENKFNESTIILLQEIEQLNNIRLGLKNIKEQKVENLHHTVFKALMSGGLAFMSCVSGTFNIISKNENINITILFISFILLLYYLYRAISEENSTIKIVKKLNIQNENMVLQIKDKVNILKKSMFFKFDNEKIQSKLNVEKSIKNLKEKLKLCNLWKLKEEDKNQENWNIVNFSNIDLVKQYN